MYFNDNFQRKLTQKDVLRNANKQTYLQQLHGSKPKFDEEVSVTYS